MALGKKQARRALRFARCFDHGWYYTRSNEATTDRDLLACLVAGEPLPLAPPDEVFGRIEPPTPDKGGKLRHTTGSDALSWVIDKNGDGEAVVGANKERPLARVAWSGRAVRVHVAGCYRRLVWLDGWTWDGEVAADIEPQPIAKPWAFGDACPIEDHKHPLYWRNLLMRLWRALDVPEPVVLEWLAPHAQQSP